METLSIGQVARRVGVGVETVRFYEREGLLEEPPRRASGYRQYSEEVVSYLRFIKRAHQLGFSLKEISKLLPPRFGEEKTGVLERLDMLMDTDTIQENGETGLLKPLFEARLQYQSDMEVVVSAETREGELVGSGNGSVSGNLLSGTARWSMYAGNCAYVFVQAGLEPPPGQHLCTVHPAGIIETSDGAHIWFDAKGYGLRGADQSQPHLWGLTMAIQFTTTHRRYQWLNTTLGVVVSEFDERAGRALWRAFIP